MQQLKYPSGMTKLKEVSGRLESLDRYIREFLDSSPNLFWISSRDGKKLHFMSSALREKFGLTWEEVKENPDAWWRIIHPDDKDRVVEAILDRRNKNGEMFRIAYRVIIELEVRWYEAQTFPIHNRSGVVVRIGGMVEDITKFMLSNGKYPGGV